MSKRVSIISTSASNPAKPSWNDAELQEFQRTFLLSPGGIIDDPATATDLQVKQIATPTNKVRILAGISFIEITKNSRTYKVRLENFDEIQLTVSGNSSGNDRIDKVVARVDVSTDPDANADNVAVIEILQGTPSGTPEAPDTPENSIALATIDVANGQTTFEDEDITDLREQVLLDKKYISLLKSDVGLSLVENYAIASQAEAEAGTATNKYMTPQRVAQAIAALGGTGLTNFTAKGDLAKHTVCQFVNDGGAGKMAPLDPIVGSSPTLGSEQNFYDDTLQDNDYQNISIAKLTDTTFVVVYNISVSPYFKAKIGTISGATISWGTEYDVAFPSVSVSALKVIALSETKFIAINSYQSYIIGDVSGTDITFGSVGSYTTSAASNVEKVQMVKLREDKVAILFIYSTSYAYLKVATISGTTLTIGTYVSISSGRYRPSMCNLTTDKVAIMLGGSSTSYAQYLYVYDVSHDSNAPTQDWSGSTATYRNYGEICQMEDGKILLRMRSGSTDDTWYFQVGTWNGSALTLGTETSLEELNAGSLNMHNNLTPLNKNLAAWAYRNESDDYGYLRMITVDGEEAIVGGATSFNAALTESPVIEKMTDLKMVLAFRDDTDTDKGHAIVVDFSIVGVETEQAVAISNDAITDGNSGEFTFLGRQMANQTGLTPAAKKYVGNDSVLTDTEMNKRFAVALNATTLLVEKADLAEKVSDVVSGLMSMSAIGQTATINHNLGRVPKKIRGQSVYNGDYHSHGFWANGKQQVCGANSTGTPVIGDGFFSNYSGDVIEIDSVTETQITFRKKSYGTSNSYYYVLELE